MHDALTHEVAGARLEKGYFADKDELLPWADPYIATLQRQYRIQNEFAESATGRLGRMARGAAASRRLSARSWRRPTWSVAVAAK